MLAVWKYNLKIQDSQEVEMPVSSRPLSVQVQQERIQLWVLVQSGMPMTKRIVNIYGTGEGINQNIGQYFIGTVQLQKGRLIFHVFIEKEQ